jgi:hypothetical protein
VDCDVCVRTKRPRELRSKISGPSHAIKVRDVLVSSEQKVQPLWSTPPPPPTLHSFKFAVLLSFPTLCTQVRVVSTPSLGDRSTYMPNSVTLHHYSPSSVCAAHHTRNGPKNLLVREEDQFATCEQSGMHLVTAASPGVLLKICGVNRHLLQRGKLVLFML